jgi:ankyrin repeat protein
MAVPHQSTIETANLNDFERMLQQIPETDLNWKTKVAIFSAIEKYSRYELLDLTNKYLPLSKIERNVVLRTINPTSDRIRDFIVGNDPSVQYENCQTPLWIAVQNGDTNSVANLIKTESWSVGASDTNNTTPLWLAAYGRSTDIVRLLLESGSDARINDKDENYHETPLIACCSHGKPDLEIAGMLLNHGADPKSIWETARFRPTLKEFLDKRGLRQEGTQS